MSVDPARRRFEELQAELAALEHGDELSLLAERLRSLAQAAGDLVTESIWTKLMQALDEPERRDGE